MKVRDARNYIGEFLKRITLGGYISWDKAEEIAVYIRSAMKDSLSPEELKRVLSELEGKYRELGGAMIQLSGNRGAYKK